MTKEELIQLLQTFSPSENKYREHPELRNAFFKNIYSEDALPVFDLTNALHDNKFFQKKDQHRFFTYSDIEFAQHTRFSHPPVHRHNHIEMTYVFQGSCQQQIHGKVAQLSVGDFCLLDSNVAHTIFDANSDDIILNIMMKKEFFSDTFLSRLANFSTIPSFILNAISEENHQEHYLILHANNNYRGNEIMLDMLLEYIHNDAYSEETIRSYMIIFLTNLLRDFSLLHGQTHHEASAVLGILKYIEDHFQTCTLKEVGHVFNYHPNYVAELLKKLTGQTFKELVITHRITKAKNLLRNTDLPVNEIGAAVGYNNLSFFYQKFRQQVGMNPRAYRLAQH